MVCCHMLCIPYFPVIYLILEQAQHMHRCKLAGSVHDLQLAVLARRRRGSTLNAGLAHHLSLNFHCSSTEHATHDNAGNDN